MPYLTILTYAAAVAVGYTVARVGLPTLYSDIKSLFTRTTTTTVTVPAPATSTTVVTPAA